MAAPRPPQFIGIPDPIVNGIPVAGPWLTGGPQDVVKGGVKGVKATANAIGWIGDPQNQVRIGEALVGLILIGVGISAMLKSTPVGKAAGGAASLAVAPLKAKQVASAAGKRAGAVEYAKVTARTAAKKGA